MLSRSRTEPMVFIVAWSCLISESKSVAATRRKATRRSRCRAGLPWISSLGPARDCRGHGGVLPDDGGAVEHDRPVLVGDGRAQCGDRLVPAYVGHGCLGRDLITGPDRCQEPPGHLEEDAARAGELFGDESVQQ